MPPEHAQDVGPLQVAVFLDELVLLAVLAIAGARLAGGIVASTFLGILLPLAAAMLWGAWLAPRARRRLEHPLRLAAKLALVAAAAVLLAVTDLTWAAIAFFVGSAVLLGAGELSARDSA
jgi:hypothetical protein